MVTEIPTSNAERSLSSIMSDLRIPQMTFGSRRANLFNPTVFSPCASRKRQFDIMESKKTSEFYFA